MNLELNFHIEKFAMSRTIKDYTTDNFISSYADQLKKCKYPEDKTILLILLNKLSGWYKKEIEVIMKGEYIHSKESHRKTYELLDFYRENFSK